MSIRQVLIAYPVTALIFVALDAVWLSLTVERLYRPALAHLMLDQVQLGPAAVFYVLYILGVVVFAVTPALESGRWSTAFGLGALLGLVAYATYDLTNQGTLKDWPWQVTIADLCWGTFATAVSAAAAYRATAWIGERLGA